MENKTGRRRPLRHRVLRAVLLRRARTSTTRTRPTQELALNGTRTAHRAPVTFWGTDNTGFDMVGRLMYGGQASSDRRVRLRRVATVVGVIYRATAGFFGGWVDALMMRIVDMLALHPGALPLDRHGDDLQPVRRAHHPRHRVRQLAHAGPARPRGNADPARPRVRPGGAGDGRTRGPHRRTAHHPQFRRHHRGVRHLPGGRLDPPAGRPGLHRASGSRRPEPTGAACSPRGADAAGNGYWWEIYPAGIASSWW
jgi:hypothetical protein